MRKLLNIVSEVKAERFLSWINMQKPFELWLYKGKRKNIYIALINI